MWDIVDWSPADGGLENTPDTLVPLCHKLRQFTTVYRTVYRTVYLNVLERLR